MELLSTGMNFAEFKVFFFAGFAALRVIKIREIKVKRKVILTKYLKNLGEF